jgi:predicted Fe-Mo cluster-binding NifX family protein
MRIHRGRGYFQAWEIGINFRNLNVKIGITSQNFRTITGHAGKTRRFLVYGQPDNEGIREIMRLDLPKDMSMHEFHGEGLHPIDELDVIVTASCGDGFMRRMADRGIRVILTSETDPLTAASAVSHGLPLAEPAPHEHHH